MSNSTISYPFIPYLHTRLTPDDMLRRADTFHRHMQQRRSIRDFSPDPLPDGLVEKLKDIIVYNQGESMPAPHAA